MGPRRCECGGPIANRHAYVCRACYLQLAARRQRIPHHAATRYDFVPLLVAFGYLRQVVHRR